MSRKPPCCKSSRKDNLSVGRPQRIRGSRISEDYGQLPSGREAQVEPDGYSILMDGVGEIARDDFTSVDGQWRTYRFAPTPTWVNAKFLHTRDMRRRPATVNNPVRSDGSRAPSGFWHFWNRTTCKVGSYVCLRSNDYVTEARSATLFGGASSVTAGAGDNLYMFAPWCKYGVNANTFPQGVESGARTKFLNKLQDTQIELGVILGEIRETYGLIGEACAGALKTLDKLARGAKKSRREVVQFLKDCERRNIRVRRTPAVGASKKKRRKEMIGARLDLLRQGIPRWGVPVINGWLAYQLGVKPLLMDIETASGLLADALVGDPEAARYTIRAGFKHVQYLEHELEYSPGPSGKITLGAMVETSCHIAATYSQPIQVGMLQRAGLDNLPHMAWELTRLTFLVDYVVNVGAWLDSLTSPSQAHFKEGTISRLQVCYDAGNHGPYPVKRGSNQPVSVSGKLTAAFEFGRFERKLLPSYGVLPGWLPVVKNRLNATRVANLLAVLSKLVR